MTPGKRYRATQWAGAARLATNAVVGAADIAEAVHMAVLSNVPAGKPLGRAASLVYGGIRRTAELAGTGVERTLGALQPWLGELSSTPHPSTQSALHSVLNGVIGDTLARNGNPLAIPMQLRRHGLPLAAGREGDAVTGRVVVLVHGLCMNDLQWRRHGHDHGELLQRERGYTPVYLHYNSGRHIGDNGRDFAQQLEALVLSWPVPVTELAIVGHSMGGLVARSACHHGALAGYRWLERLKTMVFLGSPHHGAPLERGGNWVHLLTDASKYSQPFSRLATLRSAGITDLRHGSLLNGAGDDANQHANKYVNKHVNDGANDGIHGHARRFAHGTPLPQPVPLPDGVACYTVAAIVGAQPGKGGLGRRWVGDGLVPLDSALGRHADPGRTLAFAPERQAIVQGVNHMALLDAPAVQALLLQWL